DMAACSTVWTRCCRFCRFPPFFICANSHDRISMRRIAILGATGSIGGSTLDVVARHPDRYQVHSLTAHTAVEKMAALCQRFRPKLACMADAESAARLRSALAPLGVNTTEVLAGPAGLAEIASHPDVDCVVAAIVGAAGLPASIAAARAGK